MTGTLRFPRWIMCCKDGKICLYAKSPVAPKNTRASDTAGSFPTLAECAAAGIVAEGLLFAIGISWLAVATGSFKKAVFFGLYWFVFAEVMKVLLAAAVAVRIKRAPKVRA